MSTITDAQKDKTEFTGSRESRQHLMDDAMQTFLERPLTGVGAGQFQNYNPSWRLQPWNETHNALLQVASELGVLGLLAFAFLIVRAAMGAASTRKMLAKPRKRGTPDPLSAAMDDEDRKWLFGNAVGMSAALVGWFVCSMFASVAYNWTFYYLLALIVAGRELTRDRLAAGRAVQPSAAASVPSARTPDHSYSKAARSRGLSDMVTGRA
jgi:O-antigen ligase